MKKRLDLLMVERALAPSREKAKAYIMSGDVYVDIIYALYYVRRCLCGRTERR